MRPKGRIDAFRPIVEPVEARLYGSEGRQRGDPQKAAEAIIAVVESNNPPLRLLLGADAIALWQQKRDAMTAEVAAWREIGQNTAYIDDV